MTKHQLQRFKSIITWSGVAFTFFGIILGLASGGSWWSGGLSMFGVLVTCCGHWIGNAIAKHQAAESAADKKRLSDLEERFKTSETKSTVERQEINDQIEKAASRPARWG